MKTIIILLAALSFTACSTIRSMEAPSSEVEGLNYYMPKKDIIVTVTVKNKKATDVSFKTTDSYPDLSKQYTLKPSTNLVGKSQLNIHITENGLLTSSMSKTTSEVTDIIKNAAISYANVTSGVGNIKPKPSRFPASIQNPFAIGYDSPDGKCEANGKHSFIYASFDVRRSYYPCDLTVTIEKVLSNENIKIHSKEEAKLHSGVFYRQNEPYVIKATSKNLNILTMFYSPSFAKTSFLPISKTFFANNEANFSFVNGIPTQYKQDVDGEMIALVKIPSDILGSYFTAMGTVFDGFKTSSSKETEVINNSLTLELAKLKYPACLEAFKAKDKELVEALGCK